MDLKYIVQNNLPVMPLKNYCRSYCGISMGLWRRIKWNGEVSINGEKVRPTMATVSPKFFPVFKRNRNIICFVADRIIKFNRFYIFFNVCTDILIVIRKLQHHLPCLHKITSSTAVKLKVCVIQHQV